jgi:hypothetical protein
VGRGGGANCPYEEIKDVESFAMFLGSVNLIERYGLALFIGVQIDGLLSTGRTGRLGYGGRWNICL